MVEKAPIDLITVSEAAALLRLKRSSIYAAIDRGDSRNNSLAWAEKEARSNTQGCVGRTACRENANEPPRPRRRTRYTGTMRDAVSSAVRLFLTALENVREDADGWNAKCPAHPDDKNSLHVAEAEDGRVLLHCHAGCRVEQIVHKAGRSMSDLFPRKDGATPRRSTFRPANETPEAVYDYVDETGGLLFQVVRFEGKQFRQRRPSHQEPPASPWIWNLEGVRKPLYRLPEVLTAVDLQRRGKFPQPIFVVEGEKDANALARLGLCATTNPGGAGKWTGAHTAQITGAADVIIVPDKDKPGEDHASAVATALSERVGRVRLLRLPDLPEKGDLSDWIAAGGTVAALAALADQAQVYSPPSARFTSIALGTREFLDREYAKPKNLLGDGILCTGDFGILYGVPGGGKTYAALQLGRALVRREPWFGIQTGSGRPMRVGILELEVHSIRLQARLRAIAGDAGFDERDDALQIVSRPDLQGGVNMLDAGDVAALAKWCRDERLDLLIVDALNRVHTVDENQAAQMSGVLAAFDQLRFDTGTAILLLHHEPKTGSNGRELPDLDALRGTSRLRDDPNVLIRLIKKPGDLRCLRFPKVNNAEEPSPVWLLRSRTGPLEVTEAPEKRADRNQGRVLKALIEGAPQGLTSEEIQNRSGLKKTAVSKHLAALGAVQVGQKPPRYLPPSASSAENGAEAVSSRDSSELDETLGELPFPLSEHLPPSAPSALKGGKADERKAAGMVPRGGSEATP